MNRYFAVTLACVCMIGSPMARSQDSATPAVRALTDEADQVWARLESLRQRPDVDPREQREEYRRQLEERRLEYRQLGLQFHEQFPDDARRWEWLVNTLQASPLYSPRTGNDEGAEPGIDPRQAAWEDRLATSLVPGFLASSQTTSRQRVTVFRHEMRKVINGTRAAQDERTMAALAVDPYTRWLIALAAEEAAERFEISTAMTSLHGILRAAGMAHSQRLAVARRLHAGSGGQLRDLAAGMERLLNLYEQPLELKLTTLQGSRLDIADWRGKVVLVDIWSTSCSSCVAAMPFLKEIYQRYHSQGFEMVAISLDAAGNSDKVRDILARIETPWVNSMKPAETTALRERFGITFVPLYLLLDQQGRLVGTEYSGAEGRAQLETEIHRLLHPPVASAAG